MDFDFTKIAEAMPKLINLSEQLTKGLEGMVDVASKEITKKEAENLAKDFNEMSDAVNMQADWANKMADSMKKTYKKGA